MLLTLGDSLETFIQNLDSLHALLAMSYKNLDAPSFRYSAHQGACSASRVLWWWILTQKQTLLPRANRHGNQLRERGARWDGLVAVAPGRVLFIQADRFGASSSGTRRSRARSSSDSTNRVQHPILGGTRRAHPRKTAAGRSISPNHIGVLNNDMITTCSHEINSPHQTYSCHAHNAHTCSSFISRVLVECTFAC